MDEEAWSRRSADGRVALGLRVRELRARAGLTLAELAEYAGVSLSYLSDIERGRRLPALDVLDRVCWALGLPVALALAEVYPFGTPKAPPGLAPPRDGRETRDGPAARR